MQTALDSPGASNDHAGIGIDATPSVSGVVFRVTFTEGNPVLPQGRDESPQRSHFFLGNNPDAWRTDVRTFREIVYSNLYDGIDLVYHVAAGRLKYEFVVQPGADPQRIVMVFEGVIAVGTDSLGNLFIRTVMGDLIDSAPTAFQGDTAVSCKFDLRGPLSVGFSCLGREDSEELIIDPLLYSTFLGGSNYDSAVAVAVDAAGSAYVTGRTSSGNFPTTLGSFDRTFNGAEDVFVAKVDPSGSSLVYATFLGGIGNDYGYSILLDAAGNAFVVGQTDSGNFPTTPGAFDRTYNGGGSDAFVAKLNASGDRLLYSTYLGGAQAGEDALSVALDAAGNAYIIGTTGSVNFPTTAGAFDTSYNGCCADVFITKLNSTGGGLVYSTYLGGPSSDDPWSSYSIFVNPAGEAFVTGETLSADFPTTATAFDTTFNGTSDAFVAKLNSTGTGLLYSTFLGGVMHDIGFALAVDSSGSAFVTGFTDSPDFPTTQGAFDSTKNGWDDSFVAKLNPTGSSLVYGTFLGGTASGSDSELAWSIEVDSTGNALVVGHTHSPDFPVTSDAFDSTINGSDDVFLTRLNASGTGLLYSTFLGGSGFDAGHSLAMDGAGDVYVVGTTWSDDFPITPGAFDTVPDFGATEGFVTKIGLAPRVQLTVDTSPATLAVKIDGNTFTAPYVLSCPSGSTHVLDAPSPQRVGNSNYAFVDWSDGGAQSHPIVCSSSRTITANFTAVEHLITIDTAPVSLQVLVDGIAFAAPHDFWCQNGSTLTLDVPSPQVLGTTQYLFSSWSDGGQQMHTVTCLAPTQFTAAFGTQFLVTIDTNPAQLALVVDGAAVTAPFSGYWDANSSHSAICPSPQSAGPGTRYVFMGWSDGATSPSRTIMADSSKTVACEFATEYFLAMSANAGTVVPGNGWYRAGEMVTISANAPVGSAQDRYIFDRWTGDYTGTTPSGTVLMNAPKTVTATWFHEFRIDVWSNVPSLSVLIDGVSGTLPAVQWWEEGSTHTVTAPVQVGIGPDERWNFSSWTGGTADPRLTIAAISGPGSYSASYAHQFSLTILTNPAGLSVFVDGALYTGPLWFDETSQHSLDAGSSPQSGGPGIRYRFREWETGSSVPVRAYLVAAAATLTATYDTQYRVTIETAPAGLEIIADSATYTAPRDFWWVGGTSHSLDTTAIQMGTVGTRFLWRSWSDGGSMTKSVTVTGPMTITATFQRQFFLDVQSQHVLPTCSSPDCWYDEGASASFTISSPILGSPGTRYVFTAWSGNSDATTPSAVVSMDAPKTVTAEWKTQYFLTVEAGIGEASGGGWFDAGSSAEFSVLHTEVYTSGKHYRFAGWAGGVNRATAAATVAMTRPITVIATWSEVSFVQDSWWPLAIPILAVLLIVLFLLLRRRRKDGSRNQEDAGVRGKSPEVTEQGGRRGKTP